MKMGVENMRKYLKILAQSTQEGFTLIELLIVIVIIGLLSALVGPKMFGKVGKARVESAKAQISLFETALDTYRLDNMHYPTSSEGLDALLKNPGGSEFWDGPYIKKIPKDPWGHDYVYSCEGSDDFVITSAGVDGVANTEDDISNAGEENAGGSGTVIPPG
jgi:general secretion pathway protein G